MSNTKHIIIFDGVCNFCNGAVNFIINRDTKNVFLFAPMQSPIAKQLIVEHKIDKVGFDTFLLIKNGNCYLRSNAAIEITQDLSGYWYLMKLLKIIPRSLRDYLYRLFARNRYSIFGRTESCMAPTQTLAAKFLWDET